MNKQPKSISKVLSVNDTGENGTHQAGMLIPKNGDVLYFFPRLDEEEKNPRAKMTFIDIDGESWQLSFIHYNNKLFDEHGTRNEYRLTGMTKYFRRHGLRAGDTVILKRNDTSGLRIEYACVKTDEEGILTDESGVQHVKLSAGSAWHVINY
ncbi:MAG: EcoRII N-terminal effector-binding domain-containing protein [Raoultibacter sp.]